MKLVRIVESYETGVFILRHPNNPGLNRVGSLSKMLLAARAIVQDGPCAVLVVNQDAEVIRCLRYHSGRPVVEDDPRLVYA